MRAIRVWEEVIFLEAIKSFPKPQSLKAIVVLEGPCDLLALLGIDISPWSRIEHMDTAIRIHVLNKLVQVVEPSKRILQSCRCENMGNGEFLAVTACEGPHTENQSPWSS